MTTMFSNWPPGVQFVLNVLVKLAPPLLFVMAAHRLLVPIMLPSIFWIFTYLLANPIVIFVKSQLKRMRGARECQHLGARRIPEIPFHRPGAIDYLRKIEQSLAGGYLHDWWIDVRRNYGPTFSIPFFGQDVVFTSDPVVIKAMLATDFDKFEKGARFRRWMQSVLGTGVFNSDGDLWKFHRSITRPYFVRERVTDFDLFDEYSAIVISKLKIRFRQGEAVDFQDIMSRFTLDSATEFLFGTCVNSLAAQIPYAHNSPMRQYSATTHSSDKFAAAFSQAQLTIHLRSWRGPVWQLSEFWEDKSRKDMEVINACIDPILSDALAKKERAKRQPPSESYNSEVRGTLLDHLIEQTDDHAFLRDEILNIMIAGRDTTMSTLTFVVYCLAEHPKVLARLRDEILNQIGANRPPTIDDLHECKYLRAVINETLRLYPPVPANTRVSKDATVFPVPDGGKPHYMPGGVQVFYSTWMMHRDTELWGPDAEEFDPDRFADERLHKYLIKNPFIFLPFNAGPRICIGQQFAYHEVSFMLVRLLQVFDEITLDSGAQPPGSLPPIDWKFSASRRQASEKVWPKSHLTLYAQGGLWLRMKEAHSQ